ncbi:MAG: ankyrin repeat domain-containing protein [Myxococcaceae bacterium]|nr:MAG: ankyrin repeat domain-containing protein [Myxococcaceae bacterium]
MFVALHYVVLSYEFFHCPVENGYGNTALHEACYCGHLATARVLLEEGGARMDAANHKGSTPLHMFCYGQDQARHSVEMAAYLLARGGEDAVNRSDQRGMTPLLVCSSMGRLDLIRLLLSHGADSRARDVSQRSAEQIARFYQHSDTAAFFAGEGGEGKHHQ